MNETEHTKDNGKEHRLKATNEQDRDSWIGTRVLWLPERRGGEGK